MQGLAHAVQERRHGAAPLGFPKAPDAFDDEGGLEDEQQDKPRHERATLVHLLADGADPGSCM